jgi:hypothetical protein
MKERGWLNVFVENYFIILIIGVALFINITLLLRNPNIGGDGLRYMVPIHNFVNGQGYTLLGEVELWMSPGYGLLSYFVYLLIRGLTQLDVRSAIPLSGMLVSLLSYLLIIPLVFVTTKRLFDRESAYVATFLIAFEYGLISLSYVTLSESVYSLFLVFSFYLFLRIIIEDNKSILLYFIIGITLGFSYLIRPEGFVVSLVCFLVLFIKALKNREKRVKMLGLVAIFVIAFSCMATPYVLFTHEHTGHYSVSPKGVSSFTGGGLEAVKGGERPYTTALDYIKKSKTDFIKRTSIKLTYEIYFILKHLYLVGILFLLYALLTLPFSYRKQEQKTICITPKKDGIRVLICFLVFISPLFVLPFIHVTERYLIPYVIFLIILMSFGIVEFSKKLAIRLSKTFKNEERTKCLFIILIVALLFSINIPSFAGAVTAEHGHLALREAGFWLDDNTENIEDIKILCPRKGHVALFYAGGYERKWGESETISPDLKLEEVSQYMSKGRFDYLLLDNHYIKTREEFLPLWDNPALCKELNLTLIHQKEGIFQVYAPLQNCSG